MFLPQVLDNGWYKSIENFSVQPISELVGSRVFSLLVENSENGSTKDVKEIR
jgi:hypothetical protein